MATIYLLTYCNYYNRIIKGNQPLEAYADFLDEMIENINFNPADGVEAEIVLNPKTNMKSDYMLVVEQGEITRWFIMEAVRTRYGQYRLSLRRDIISDYFQQVMDSTAFIEKGHISQEDIAIFNSEDMTYNQIKKSETLLKDKTNCPWIIGYYSRKYDADKMKGTVNTNTLNDQIDILLSTPIENWEYYKYSNLSTSKETFKGYPKIIDYITYAEKKQVFGQYDHGKYRLVLFDTSGNGDLQFTPPGTNKNFLLFGRYDNVNNEFATIKQNYKNAGSKLKQDVIDAYQFTTQEEENEFVALNGKLVKDTKGQFYSVSVVQNNSNEIVYHKVSKNGKTFNTMKSLVQKGTGITGEGGEDTFELRTTWGQYSLVLTEEKGLSVQYDMTGEKDNTTDTPYDIFAIPYGEVTVKYEAGQPELKTNARTGLETAMSIMQQNPNIVYDIQLLPFFPMQNILSVDGTIKCKNSKQYSLVKQDKTVQGIIFNVPLSKFNFTIFLDKPINPTDKKIASECDMYRLCSPNWNGIFEFNAVKNGGVSYFDVDCTYKPFNPYIHINPDFGLLYGKDFNDARGLVCGGDFSLPSTIDQWQSYAIQNKNFQQSFDRQIENMEINNKIQKAQDIVGAVAGTVQGGAIGGMMTGNVGGAVGGSVLSGVAGVADVVTKDILRKEAIDYTKDQFGYNLANIKALPNTLTKVSAYNNNNKIFPVLEYYTCTEIEKEALKNKIKYNGYTVMRIGTIREYCGYNNYIKCKLIRTAIKEDTHLVQELSMELYKGVFI